MEERVIRPVISSVQEHATVNDDLCPALTAAAGMGGGQTAMIIQPGIKVVGLLDMTSHDMVRRVYAPEGISPTVDCCEGGEFASENF